MEKYVYNLCVDWLDVYRKFVYEVVKNKIVVWL